MITPRPYQTNGVNQIALNYSKGIRRNVFQMPTGSGKTITFCMLVERFMRTYNSQIVIAVHRDELLKNTRAALFNHFNINSQAIRAGRKQTPSQVNVCMVETLYNRLKKDPNYFKSVGLLIIDECHIGNFKKLYDYFEESLIVGFSATPIAASKKDPMKNHFDEIICGPTIMELIQSGNLCQNETYAISGINRKDFKIKRGEFDMSQMSSTYSSSKHVQNVVAAYDRLCENKKTIIFNCNVDHSLKVNEAFLAAGYEARHLDGTSKNRAETLAWFKRTPNAILNNIGVLTTGFDEPSIINVITNRSTTSLPLWLQMTGRGSRPFPNKEYFRIIDMGGNALVHGDWRAEHDWEKYFHHPDKPRESNGVAPIKTCENCEALIAVQTRKCPFCEHVHERIINYDLVAPEFEKIVGRINAFMIARDTEKKGHKEWKTFFIILNKTVKQMQYQFHGMELSQNVIDSCFKQFEIKVKEWCKAINKPFSKYVKEFAKKKFDEELEKLKLIRA